MAVLFQHRNYTTEIRWFLAASRAHADARAGIRELQRLIEAGDPFKLFEWKVQWTGCLALLRTSIDVFQREAHSCLPDAIKQALEAEFKIIRDEKTEHSIFWDFIRRERDQILHNYEWSAYQVWLDEAGTAQDSPSLLELTVYKDQFTPMMRMREGPFKGRNSLELLHEAEKWVEARIESAIRRAGYDPNEQRSLWNFGVVERPPGLMDNLTEDLKGHLKDT